MMSKIIRILYVFIVLLILVGCDTKQKHYNRRLTEAKWLYYESNFTKLKTACFDNKSYEENICFFGDLKIDTIQISDTIEFTIRTKIGNSLCIPYNGGGGLAIDVFGFYPKSDTVCYRSNRNMKPSRKPEVDSIVAKFESMSVFTRSKQKKLFMEYVYKNWNKLCPWLRAEAEKRGYKHV